MIRYVVLFFRSTVSSERRSIAAVHNEFYACRVPDPDGRQHPLAYLFLNREDAIEFARDKAPDGGAGVVFEEVWP